MSQASIGSTDLGFKPGDHVCAFYSSSSGQSRDEIIAFYVAEGLRAGHKCTCFVDDPLTVSERIPGDLLARSSEPIFREAHDAYLPDGEFSKEAHIRRLDALGALAVKEGYSILRLLGDASFIIRDSVDRKEWFAYEAEVNNFAPRYPQFLLCLYNLDLVDGVLVSQVLRTHPRILLNGIVIHNPYYTSSGEVHDSVPVPPAQSRSTLPFTVEEIGHAGRTELAALNSVLILSLILAQATSEAQVMRLAGTAIPLIVNCQAVAAWHPDGSGEYYDLAPEEVRGDLRHIRPGGSAVTIS